VPTHWAVEWESKLLRDVMSARCYPFEMPQLLFMGPTHRYTQVYSTNQYILVHTGTYFFKPVYFSAKQLCSVKDTIVIVPPYPFCIEVEDDLDDVPPKNLSYRISRDDLLFHLVFFSTFEELNLPIHGPTEDAGVIKLY
jgi:hypothetical protein